MKRLLICLVAMAATTGFAQQHDQKPPDAMKDLGFMVGSWSGTQTFNNPGGTPMSADTTSNIELVVGGRFVQERIRGKMQGRSDFETIHMMSFDPGTGMFTAWWFNDTSRGPNEYEGKVDGESLVMLNKRASQQAPQLRVTYSKSGKNGLKYKLEMKRGDDWAELFHTDYSRAEGK